MNQELDGNILIRYIVMLGDFLLLNVLLFFFINFFFEGVAYDALKDRIIVFMTANVALAMSEACFDVVVDVRNERFVRIVWQAIKMTLTQTVLMFTVLRVIYNPGGVFVAIVKWWPMSFCLVVFFRMLELTAIRFYRRMGRNTRRVILVGWAKPMLKTYENIMMNPFTGYRTLGYFSDDDCKGLEHKVKNLGSIADLKRMMEEENPLVCGADEIFVSLPNDESNTLLNIVKFCDRNMIHFFYVPVIFGDKRLNLAALNCSGQVLFTNHAEPLNSVGNKMVKRVFDIVCSSFVCLCMLPFMPIVALIIKRQSPGPLFFRQERTGLNGETFYCYKFRSMHVNKDADTMQATKDDPRKFPFGNFMRKTNIDELPQFINVLKGDMSIVGPRPHMLKHTEMYHQLIDEYMVRHYCKPGITGLAQVRGYRGETKELWMMEKRVESDIEYMESWTFLMDIKICLETAFQMLFHQSKNAY